MFENPRRGRQARNFTTNVPKILDLKWSSEQIFSENLRWVPRCITHATTGNRVCKTDATCTIQQCWELLANNITSVSRWGGMGGGGGLYASGERWRLDKRDPRSSLSKSYRNELLSYSVEVSLLSPEVNTLYEDVSCKAKFWVCLRKDMAWRFKRTLFTRSSASHHLLWSFFETMKFVGVQPRPRLFALTKGHLCIFRL